MATAPGATARDRPSDLPPPQPTRRLSCAARAETDSTASSSREKDPHAPTWCATRAGRSRYRGAGRARGNGQSARTITLNALSSGRLISSSIQRRRRACSSTNHNKAGAAQCRALSPAAELAGYDQNPINSSSSRFIPLRASSDHLSGAASAWTWCDHIEDLPAHRAESQKVQGSSFISDPAHPCAIVFGLTPSSAALELPPSAHAASRPKQGSSPSPPRRDTPRTASAGNNTPCCACATASRRWSRCSCSSWGTPARIAANLHRRRPSAPTSFGLIVDRVPSTRHTRGIGVE